MSKFVLVAGPSVTGVFGADCFEVEDDSAIVVDAATGVLQITATPSVKELSMKPDAKPSVFMYPRGGWTRVKIRDFEA